MKDPKDGLLPLLNQANTAFGKRMMKRWIFCPLTSIDEINARLDAVEELRDRGYELESLKRYISRLPDLERATGLIYANMAKSTSAIYFEDVSSQRLKDFKEILEKLRLG
jgi:DNA mismatch repair protein MutS